MRVLYAVLLLLWMLAFLWLTLWPFDFSRKNRATFVPDKGLQFSSPSIAMSEGAPSKICGLDSVAVLLTLYPESGKDLSCILDYAPVSGPANLRVFQLGRQLSFSFRGENKGNIQLRVPTGSHDSLNTFFFAVRGKRVSAGRFGTVAATVDSHAPIGASWNRNAQLIFGCTASGKFRWEGTLAGFEVYRINSIDSLPDSKNVLLSYQFAQHEGRLIPDNGREPGTPLIVPQEVKAPARKMLSSPFTYWDGIWNKSDIVYNIIALLPLGILFSLLFTGRLKPVALVLSATLFACALSLSIEIAQFFVPYRDSSIIDVITNSFGAFCGAWVPIAVRSWVFRTSPKSEV